MNIKKEDFIKNAEALKEKTRATPHTELLQKLLVEIQPLDFQLLSNPIVQNLRNQLNESAPNSKEAEELKKQLSEIKVNQRQLRILTIENVVKTATENHWNLCKNLDYIYIYNGAYWAEIHKEEFQMFLGEAAEKMGVTWDNARDFNFRERLYKQFLATEYMKAPEDEPDKVLINLKNGTYEIGADDIKLREFNSNDFITYQLSFEYNPEATAPLFHKYLERVLPDKERQNVLAEFMGYVFIKHGSSLKMEAALVLYGPGRNGKSVFYEVILALLGKSNVSSFSLKELTDNSGYYRAMMANKLANYASEINGKLDTSSFKAMVSGETISTRLPHGKPIQISNYGKFIFNCNELPKDVEHTEGFFRRWLIIPFDVSIPKNEQDLELHKKIIQKELSGVFNWVLDGLKRLLIQKRFSNCEASNVALEEYKKESNSVKQFIDEYGYKISTEKKRLIKELYQDYKQFCIEDGMTPFKKINFNKQLRALGYVVCKASQNKLVVFIEASESDL